MVRNLLPSKSIGDRPQRGRYGRPKFPLGLGKPLRYYWRRAARLRDSPERLARGLAAGVFAGCFPIFGGQIAIGIGLALAVRGNKFMAAIGTWISNPLTYLPIYLFNFQVGCWLLGMERSPLPDLSRSSESLLDVGWDVSLALVAGSCAVGLPAAIAAYTLGVRALRRSRRRRR